MFMSTSRIRVTSWLFGALIALICFIPAFGLISRISALPDVIRYVPSDFSMFVYSASIGELWDAADGHLYEYFERASDYIDLKERESEFERDQGPITQSVSDFLG